MTIQRARELLGEDATDLSDTQVGEVLQRTSALCSSLLDLVLDDIVKATPAHDQFSHAQNSSYLCSRERPITG